MDLEGIRKLKGIERERAIKRLSLQELEDIEPLFIFEICNAIWIHNGIPEAPHALLTSGKHSDGYIDCSQVLKYSNLKYILATKLLHKAIPFIEKCGFSPEKIDYVVSSSMAAIPLGEGIANALNSIFLYTEKVDGRQKLKRFEILDGAVVLQVEELITTLKTTREVREAILEKNRNVKFVSDKDGKVIVLTLVHRPEKLPIEYPDFRVFPLIELEIHNWDSEDCPLCRAGSKVLKPKENWELFLKHNKFLTKNKIGRWEDGV